MSEHDGLAYIWSVAFVFRAISSEMHRQVSIRTNNEILKIEPPSFRVLH